jgi:hypothetical protein
VLEGTVSNVAKRRRHQGASLGIYLREYLEFLVRVSFAAVGSKQKTLKVFPIIPKLIIRLTNIDISFI